MLRTFKTRHYADWADHVGDPREAEKFGFQVVISS